MTPPWLSAAQGYVGTKEVPGSGDNAVILKWMPYSGLDETWWHDKTAWCAIFCSGMLEEAGYRSSRNAMARSYMRFGERCEPKPGAIMVMPRGKPPSGHVGFVERVSGKYVHTIEGNVSDQVLRKKRRISYALGYRWPVEKLDGSQLSDPPSLAMQEVETVTTPKAVPIESKGYDTKTVTTSDVMSRFTACLDETLEWEGGYSNDKYDSGGATMRGVIQRRYSAYRKRKGLKYRSVRRIEDHELQEIYRVYYWDEVKGDTLPAGLDQAVFDFGVNSGPSRSIKYLQAVLQVPSDGHMGPITYEALEGADVEETIRALCASRRRFVRRIKVYWRFGKGWERRINGIEAASLEAVGDEIDVPDVPIPRPNSDPEAQSESQGRADDEKPKLDAKTIGTIAVSGGGALGGALSTDVPGTVVESVKSVPMPPQEVMDGLSSWQAFSMQVQSASTMAVEHWQYVLVAGAVWALVAYGLPWWYRESRP